MALPTTENVAYGIVLKWGRNNTNTFGNTVPAFIHIQRTTGSVAAATSAWTAAGYSKYGGSDTWTDELPSDGKRRWYRIRQYAAGYEPSTWLGNVDAKPTELVEIA